MPAAGYRLRLHAEGEGEICAAGRNHAAIAEDREVAEAQRRERVEAEMVPQELGHAQGRRGGGEPEARR